MALLKTKGSQIRGIVSVVPANREDNASLELIPEAEREILVKHTGIRFRRIVQNSLDVKALFQESIEKLLEKLAWEKASVDVLVCVTQTPKVSIPSVSCRLHGDMEFSSNTLCFDINSGCSGFVYGLHNVSAIMQGIDKPNARAILCCGDVSSLLIESCDRTVRPVFSDAVSAIGIEMIEDKEKVTGYFNLETDGNGQEAISTSVAQDGDAYMRLNGIDIFNFSLKYVPSNITKLLAFAQKDTHFPDLFVFHQANKLINESIRKRLALDESKVPYSLYEFGNTASASIPLTLGTSWKAENSNSGWIVVSGFGVGFSMASALIPFDPDFCLAPIEIV